MINCPVCNTKYENRIDFCGNEECEWEFKYFLSGLSEELLARENKRLAIAKKKYEKIRSLELNLKQ